MEYSPENAIPYLARVDAGTVESVRKRGVEVVSSGDLVQRFVALWDAAALESHLAASAALYRVKDRAFAAIARASGRRRADQRIRDPAAHGWLVQGRGPADRCAPGRREHGERRQPALHAGGRREAGRSAATSWCCSICGASWQRPAPFTPISPGWGSPAPSVPDEFARAFDAIARARDAAVDLVKRSVRDGRRSPRLAGGPRGARGAAGIGLRRARAASHGPQPRHRRARQRRPHGRLRDARRPAGCSRARGSRSSRASTSRTSACERK